MFSGIIFAYFHPLLWGFPESQDLNDWLHILGTQLKYTEKIDFSLKGLDFLKKGEPGVHFESRAKKVRAVKIMNHSEKLFSCIYVKL